MVHDKKLRERGVGRKGVYLLPNLFTTAGLFFGFYAIVQATKGDFANAALAIFVAMVMDGLDGRVARWTNTASDFGKEYDSLVDVISFGLTPALVMYEWSLSQNGKLGWLSAFLYVAATALRLARFNTQDSPDKRYFVGLPCPAAAAFAAAWVWLFDSTNTTGSAVEVMSIVVTMCLGLAMVTNIPYKSFKDWDLKGRVPFVRLIVPVLVLILVVSDPPRILFLGFLIYFLSGPAIWLITRARGEPITETEFDSAEDGDTESDTEWDGLD
ncbi:MAG: CDP-diacylglycerol--serine O-phosphatidyltransferase [Gammaproteobacteria bacterium]|nr:CDP-diacylglycerol--serine O-phosphatidyltransferase [Gammaproteobacteria bacterium]MDH3469208.1 CDP-diacylglycerol--serine O-phosphatidyltransferase [Gammaproteobacteria bacterium]